MERKEGIEIRRKGEEKKGMNYQEVVHGKKKVITKKPKN